MKRRILTLSLSLVLVLSCFRTAPALAAYDGGSGTRTSPYLISTAQQLMAFRDQVNGGRTTLCAVLTDNIDLSGIPWTPIGLTAQGYQGIFDGSGYQISNLSVDTSSLSASSQGAGLFGVVGKSGTVKRLNLSGTITATAALPVFPDLGLVCGSNLGTVEECAVSISLSLPSLTVTSDNTGHVNLGAIAGLNKGLIRNCYATGSIRVKLTSTQSSVPLQVGGLVGYSASSSAKTTTCYSAVSLSASGNGTVSVGGAIGVLQSGTGTNLYADRSLCSALTGGGTLSSSSLLATSAMKGSALVTKLGAAFSLDTEKENGGYPVLSALAYSETPTCSQWFQEEALISTQSQQTYALLVPAALKNRDLTRSITREEFCAVAVQLYEEMGGTSPDPSTYVVPFTDTDSDAVKKAFYLGITNGTSDTTFSPYASISREQMATMLARVYKALYFPGWAFILDSHYPLDYSGTALFSDDAAISSYAKSSVYFMVKNQIIKGTSATTFSPRNLTAAQVASGYANASREQAIIIAIRMYSNF